jgi:hypothetical protein
MVDCILTYKGALTEEILHGSALEAKRRLLGLVADATDRMQAAEEVMLL